MSEYNGWTNFATWKVCLEFGITDRSQDFAEYDDESLKEYVYDALSEGCENQTTLDYADCFLEEVDWREIVEAVQRNEEERKEYAEELNKQRFDIK